MRHFSLKLALLGQISIVRTPLRQPPVRSQTPATAHRAPHRAPRGAARRHRDRQLLLAAREVQSQGGRVSGGGERLHRGHDQRPEALQRRALQGDARPHQADRSHRAHPPRRLLLLLAHRRRQAVPHPVPPQRQHGGARRGAARSQRTGQGPEVRRPRRLRRQRRSEPAGLHHRLHRLPPVRPAA